MSAQALRKEVHALQKEKKFKLIEGRSKGGAKKTSKPSAEPSVEQIQQLVIENREGGRKLARSILNQWRVRMPAEEIYSIVDLTLCEAAKRFRPDKGASFMTFLFYHMRGQLVRAVASAANANHFIMAHARNSGIDLGDWENYQADALPHFIEPNALGVHHVETPEEQLIQKERELRCRGAMEQLETLEQQVLNRAYGNEQQITDIAHELGYSRCHISRVKRAALEQLENLLKRDFSPEAPQAEAPVSETLTPKRDAFRRRNRQRAALRKLTGAFKLKRRAG